MSGASKRASKRAGGRCLVLGYDATESGRRAVAWAANELAPDGRLVLVHSDRPLHAPPSPLASAEERAQIGRAIFDELLLDGTRALLDIDFSTEVSDEDPASALVAAAERHHAAAIVVGCEPHSRLHRLLGVLTDELLKRSPVPVIAVPAGVNVPPPADDPPRRARTPRARSG